MVTVVGVEEGDEEGGPGGLGGGKRMLRKSGLLMREEGTKVVDCLLKLSDLRVRVWASGSDKWAPDPRQSQPPEVVSSSPPCISCSRRPPSSPIGTRRHQWRWSR